MWLRMCISGGQTVVKSEQSETHLRVDGPLVSGDGRCCTLIRKWNHSDLLLHTSQEQADCKKARRTKSI